MKGIKKRIWIPAAIAILAGVLIFSLVQVFTSMNGYQQGDSVNKTIQEAMQQVPSAVGGQTETGPTQAQKYIMELQKLYPGAVGRIVMEDSVIDYPIMQGKDNNYYLGVMPDGTKNSYGSIFLDSRNGAEMKDSNIIIYGHAMNNGSMFGSLQKFEDSSYYEAHPTFRLYTPDGEKTCQIFSVYQSKLNGFCYMMDFKNDRQFYNYLTEVKKMSLYEIPVEVTAEDQIVTLSTCTGGAQTNRMIIQAKILKEE